MNWDYEYTPYIWPMLASAAFVWALGLYGWRHRASPGALAFTIGCGLVGLWAVGNACELAATDRTLAFWWFRFQMILSTPSAAAGLCFVLRYAGLGRWLNRTALALLITPSILMVPAYLLDDARLLWNQVQSVDGRFVRNLAPLGVAWNLYDLAILALSVAGAVFLFVRSPLYRKAAALMMLGHSAIVGVQVLEIRLPAPVLRPSLMILSIDFTFAMYAIAFLHYRLLDVVPVARESVVERMPDAVVILDASNRVADLNLAAQQLLGLRREGALGRQAAEALAAAPDLAALTDCHAYAEVEVSVTTAGATRWYRVNTSPILDGRGFHLGCLMVMHETTELRLAQERVLQQEHATATLQERERVARELHDSIGQVLGYVSMQVEATRKLLEDGKVAAGDAQLARLANVARDAHADLRGFILELRAAPSGDRPFVSALERYLDGFGQNYNLRTELVVTGGLKADALGPRAQGQLFRIVQEALTNARKHGGARSVQVHFETTDEWARVIVEDDGSGFDPAGLTRVDGRRFGLQFMRERAGELGGQLEIDAAPGRGTRIVVEVPLGLSQGGRDEHESIAG
ncbi:MAG: histidine kinase N-terminal 7TM domain-containing protein [Anaerolineae bacterium]|jgi:PAS domain S-box-containing protein